MRTPYEWNLEFKKQWDKKQSDWKQFTEVMVFRISKEVINRFLTLNPKYISFELTEDCSVFFQSCVDKKNIYLELWFDDEIEDNVEIVINIYQDKKCISAYSGSIKNVFLHIEKTLNTH